MGNRRHCGILRSSDGAPGPRLVFTSPFIIIRRLTQKEIAMGLSAQKSIFTADDYLAWETAQLERHEFIDGEVFAMAGAEDRHITVSMNVAFALRQHLSGSPCRT